MVNSNNRDVQAQRSCAEFWGPTKPFVGGDRGIESGGSFYVPTFVLFATRVLTLSFLLGMMIYLIIVGAFSLAFVTNWSYLLFTITWTFITATSLLLLLRKTAFADKLARFAVPFHFVGVCAALYIIPVYYALIYEPPILFRQFVVHGGTFVCYLIDILLGSMMRFKIQYCLFTIAWFLLYLAFLWIRYAIWRNHPDFFWPYNFLDFTVVAPATLTGIYLGLFAFTVVVSVIVVLTNRLVPLFASKRKQTCREPTGNHV